MSMLCHGKGSDVYAVSMVGVISILCYMVVDMVSAWPRGFVLKGKNPPYVSTEADTAGTFYPVLFQIPNAVSILRPFQRPNAVSILLS